jgi:hypothetical protein
LNTAAANGWRDGILEYEYNAGISPCAPMQLAAKNGHISNMKVMKNWGWVNYWAQVGAAEGNQVNAMKLGITFGYTEHFNDVAKYIIEHRNYKLFRILMPAVLNGANDTAYADFIDSIKIQIKQQRYSDSLLDSSKSRK